MSTVGKPSPLSKSTKPNNDSNLPQVQVQIYGKGLENLSDHDLHFLSVSLFDDYMVCEDSINEITTLLDVYSEMQKRGLPMVQKI